MLDFAVIGGGIAGISAAARLAPHGEVVVFERESALGYHASGRSAALFEERYGLASTIALNRASREIHRTIEGGVLSPRGLMLVSSGDDTELFARDLAAMELPEITPAEAKAIVPILRSDRLARAAFHEEAWDIDTDRLIQAFARLARQNGGRIVTKTAVTAIERTMTGWRLTAGDDAIEARILVNAAGAWADGIATLSGITPIGLKPLRRSMARIPAPGGHDMSRWPMILAAGETWYAKPDAGQLLVSPADEDLVEPHDAWADDLTIAEGLARYEAMVDTPVTRVTATWAGLRTFSPDKSLVIGPDPEDAAFFWCAGQGGYGMQTSPAAAECLAAHVTGASHTLDRDVVAQLAPARFR